MKELRTKRLLLRQIEEQDYEFMKYYLSDAERTKFLPLEKPYPENEVEKWVTNRIEHWQKNNFGTYIVQLIKFQNNIGFCGLEYVGETDFIDIRYGLMQEVWGKGYAYEAAIRTVKYGFENLSLNTIYGAAVPENSPSIHILKKIGMSPDAEFNYYGNVVDPYSIRKINFIE
ncbi:MAG: GNAT family N-acetyltransferase [Bacteroidetes bacterium]|nr:GNAT family N-acetyltransferase [Bacteroidota bacterium]